jgi:MOSC domain-containing protein
MWLDAIWRYPIKSAAGQQLDSARLGELGVPGDRAAYVVDRAGATVSGRTKPRLLGLYGSLAQDGTPLLDGHDWDAPQSAQLVCDAAGSGARLVRAESFERFDILPLLVATDGAVDEAGLDIRRLRPNLAIGGVEGLAERTWEGRFLRIGDAVVGLATLRERCIVTTFEPDTLEQDVGVLLELRRRFAGELALNAWTARAATVRVGDAVELLDSFDDADMPGLGRFVAGRP